MKKIQAHKYAHHHDQHITRDAYRRNILENIKRLAHFYQLKGLNFMMRQARS